MIRNYLKTAFRSIFRNKLTAFINIAGLALAMGSSLMIYLFVSDEVSFDQYNHQASRTYRVTRNFLNNEKVSTLHLATVAPPIGPLLKNDFGVDYYNQFGKEAYKKYLKLKEDLAKEKNPVKKKELLLETVKLGDTYNF